MNRSDNLIIYFLEKWIKSLDLVNITLIISLMILGLIFVTTASPNVAKLKNLKELHFIKKHYSFTLCSCLTMIFFLFIYKGLINISLLGFTICFIFLASLIFSQENNGAVRWFNIVYFRNLNF